MEEVARCVEDKWNRRRIQAARVMKLQGRKQPSITLVQSDRNVKSVILQGYIDVSNEICTKITRVANSQIRMVLNKPVAHDGLECSRFSS